MATPVGIVIDPDMGAGYDYDSQDAYDITEAGDLVTADEYHHLELRCTGGTADTKVLYTGWTMDATHYVQVKADGIYAMGRVYAAGNKYRMENTNDVAIDLRDGATHFRFIGFGIKTNNTSTNNKDGIILNHATTQFAVEVSNMIFSEVGNGKGQGVRAFASAAGSELDIWNCIAIDRTDGVGYQGTSGNFTVTLYNCLAHNCKTGFRRIAGTANAYNCVADGGTTCFLGTIGGSHNTSSDATAPGTDALINQDPAYDDEANDDFMPAKGDTTMLDVGATDPGSGLFVDDIEGTTRPQGAAWDRGPSERIVSGGGRMLLMGVG